MNTWGYLILIAALLSLSAFMLYARFAARSREKSLHHAPQDAAIVTATLVNGPEGPAGPANESFEEEYVPDEPLVVDFKPLTPEEHSDSTEDSESGKKEEEYFDELQEAAAGLAMLMRSSPAKSRPEPVVFAPEAEDEAVDAVAQERDRSNEPASHETDLPGTNESVEPARADAERILSTDEAMDQVETLLDGPSVFAEETLPAVAPVSGTPGESLRNILGDELVERFQSIDESLEQLRSLVEEMEGELVAFNEFLATPVEEEVGVAA